MKKIIIAIIVACFSLSASAQIKVRVDEKFELTSILFFMAGVPEYWDCAIPKYRADIIEKLSPYELTEPVNFIRELNIKHAIGYNAVSTTADMLEIKHGKIQLQSKYNIADIAKYNRRWTQELFEKYIKMINIFYKQSKFHKFFTDHRPLYELAEGRMNEHIKGTAVEWFKSFYGKELPSDINVYISLVNAQHNYSFASGILLGVISGSDSLPAASSFTVPLLIHELGHHYVNPLVDKYWAQLESAANRIYPHIKDQMVQNAYGNAKTVMIEWLNNLFQLMYQQECEDPFLKLNISKEVERGFIGMERSVEFMQHFYDNRDKYPIIEDFMPQLIASFDFMADNIEFVKREIEIAQPYIANVFPALNSDLGDTKEIVITFSEPMVGSYSYRGRPSGTEYLQVDLDGIRWSDDKLRCIIPIFAEKMDGGKSYGLTLTNGFRSVRYFSLDERSRDLVWIKK